MRAMSLAHRRDYIRKKILHAETDLALLLQSRKIDRFPKHDLKKQIEFIAKDLLFVRQIFLGEVDPQDKTKIKIVPNGKALNNLANTLLKLATAIHKIEKQESTESAVDVDELVSPQRQREIEEARQKNQEAIDAAIANTREDGLPKTPRGYTWKSSSQPGTPGIEIPEYKDINGQPGGAGGAGQENSSDAEGIRSSQPVTRID